MPRISAASLAVVPVFEVAIPPPPHLGPVEAAIFRDTVASADANHFRGEDRELLCLYACHCATARRLMKKRRRTLDEQSDLVALTSLIMRLSARLRLGPKSRSPDNRRAAGAGLQNSALQQPWELGQDKAEQPAAPRAPVDWTTGAGR
jgi:hypothetical protein